MRFGFSQRMRIAVALVLGTIVFTACGNDSGKYFGERATPNSPRAVPIAQARREALTLLVYLYDVSPRSSASASGPASKAESKYGLQPLTVLTATPPSPTPWEPPPRSGRTSGRPPSNASTKSSNPMASAHPRKNRVTVRQSVTTIPIRVLRFVLAITIQLPWT